MILISKRIALLAALVMVAVLAAAVAPGLAPVAAQPVAAGEEGVSLPVIMYHSILKDSHAWNKYVISPGEFEQDLAWLKKAGYTAVTVQDLIDYVAGEKDLPEKPVMLTFDDGYYSVYLYAYPLLKKYDMKAVFSIIGRYTDQFSLSGDNNPAYAHVTWDEVRELSDSGIMEIQNHTYNMHTLSSQRQGSMRASGESYEHYEQAMLTDVLRLQALIDACTRRLPTAFTYPYGFVSQESGGILRDIGFRASFSCYNGINLITRNPECLFMLKRLLRPHGKSVESLLKGAQ